MSEKFEVSFNSPQCGWMSIGFEAGHEEFHTTTAHAPHTNALTELLETLVQLLEDEHYSHILRWNRDPEEFDFAFERNGDRTLIEIVEYPTEERDQKRREIVFSHRGDTFEIVEAFRKTFAQLFEERDTDEFEQNWHQPFPVDEYKTFESALSS